MADDLDKFTLQYQVELKDSISRLEKLQEKMNGVQAKAKGGAKEIKNFAADASSELGKLVPGLNAVSGAVRTMGAEFAAATAALGALALGVKMVLNLREQYNRQRSEGMQLGVSSTRMEEYTRKFVKGSGGYVNRDQAVEGIKNFAGIANAAYTDPTRLGREARLMKMLGVNVGERGATPTGLNTELQQLALGLQGKSKGDVQGIAKATGMSQDWLLTVQKLGPSIGKITEMTSQEIEKRNQAEQSLAKFNDELGQLKERFTELSNTLAEPLLPALTKLVQLMDEIAKKIPKLAEQAGDRIEQTSGVGDTKKAGAWRGGLLNGLMSLVNGDIFAGKGNRTASVWDIISSSMGMPTRSKGEEAKKAEAEKKAADKRDESVDKLDDINKQGLQTANEMALAVNMFAGAVQSFSSAINIQQAWAAWAGEIGKANNLPGSSSSSVVSKVGPTQYDDLFAKYAKKEGVPVDLLKRIAQVESTMNPKAVSETGATGLMQITRGNQKAYGMRDATDPEENISVGAKILKYFMGRNPNDLPAALRGYNGNSDPNYVSKVLGSGTGMGESKTKMNVRAVQESIANYLHIPLEQMQQGKMVTQGDAGWASRQIQAGISNNIYDIQRQLSVGGLPQQNYAKLQQELREQSRGLDMMRQYSGEVIARAQPGGQERTVGEQPIIINVNGATDPKAVALEVNNQLKSAMNGLLYNYSTAIKR